jgi:hypothetical protein
MVVKNDTRKFKEKPAHRQTLKTDELRDIDTGHALGGDVVISSNLPALQQNETPEQSVEHPTEIEKAKQIMELVNNGLSVTIAIKHVLGFHLPENHATCEIGSNNSNESLTVGQKIDHLFSPHYGKIHLDDKPFDDEFVINGFGTFSISVRKLGQTTLLRRRILNMLENPTQQQDLIKYKERKPDPTTRKKMNPFEFFMAHYGEFAAAKAIYAHELRALDSSLYKNLSTTVSDGISSLLPTKSVKVTTEIQDLISRNAIGSKAIAAAYNR